MLACWLDSLVLGFRRMFCYGGRATRREFWCFLLTYWAYWFVLLALYSWMEDHVNVIADNVLQGMFLLWELALVSLMVRRLRDAGYPVWPVAIYPALLLVSYVMNLWAYGFTFIINADDAPSSIFVTLPYFRGFASLVFAVLLLFCMGKSRPPES